MTSRCSLDTIWRANWNIHNMEGSRVIPSIYNTEGWAGARGKKIGGMLLTKERGKMPRLVEEDALQAKFSKVHIVLMLSFNLMSFQGGWIGKKVHEQNSTYFIAPCWKSRRLCKS